MKNSNQEVDLNKSYTLEECINNIGLGKFQWCLITILGFCSMADAVEMMLLAILGPALTCYWPTITEVQIASLTTVNKLFYFQWIHSFYSIVIFRESLLV